MTTLYCKQGGLQEDPYWHWEVIGEAEGSTTKEVADNLAKTNTAFKQCYSTTDVTFWGWTLSIEPQEVGKYFK